MDVAYAMDGVTSQLVRNIEENWMEKSTFACSEKAKLSLKNKNNSVESIHSLSAYNYIIIIIIIYNFRIILKKMFHML